MVDNIKLRSIITLSPQDDDNDLVISCWCTLEAPMLYCGAGHVPWMVFFFDTSSANVLRNNLGSIFRSTVRQGFHESVEKHCIDKYLYVGDSTGGIGAESRHC